MTLSPWDIGIVIAYVVGVLLLGFYLSKKSSKNLESYFLGGNELPWYYLGLSNASGMFDISGTMWSVGILFVYGLKSAWLPWLWPVWNQVFVFVYLAIWMRRSNVMTGAEWITFRFGDGKGAKLSHIIIVIFAVISVLGFIAYFFEGIGKYCTSILPWDMAFEFLGYKVSSARSYALIICGLTSLYTVKGGMHSVVATEVMQFVIMTFACVGVGIVAYNMVTAEQIASVVPETWGKLSFGWKLDLDWSNSAFPQVNNKIASDGFDLFGILFILMVLKGVFASIAGPVPSYDMQRVLATKTPVEAAKMSFLTVCVLYIPRYFMIIGFAVLALVYLGPELLAMGDNIDFEQVLPMAINKFLPVGLKGLMLAGFLAAFMGTFAAFVNSAPAYIVNDIYKKYINPGAPDKKLVQLSIVSSLFLVMVGIIFGFNAGSLNTLILWLSSSLYGGYVAANVLKWIWWRFSGNGYFWGMLFGLIASTVKFIFFPNYVDIFVFPLIFAFALLGCIIGTFLEPLPNREQVKKFYKQTKPWGFWGPIKKEVTAEDPSFVPNLDFKRDTFNVIVGIIWQMAQVVIPIYFMLRQNTEMLIWSGILILTSVLLKKYWWDNLKEIDT
ncbi:sodium:solute symporter family protein [Maribacter sp. HTCC2170]|uniref:sodium:solute symporter family protein n=1 Tax=Maribacter sp. (strain HTCC2170 / KCCM 42371) TaxID=313603 RepID=UPI00006BB137|nr:sodium:solute symporter family protein [Maribacter sp. HTCC2170]EAQ99609.1 Na+/glucose symporter [Maribacter sp. HTCC2170]